jgi:hypothetical protein
LNVCEFLHFVLLRAAFLCNKAQAFCAQICPVFKIPGSNPARV